ncbi:MAG: hypothetical protein K2O06_16180 [Acetatifactor sp.]|nr:hypothetical protein [Acetatifactor sp.]
MRKVILQCVLMYFWSSFLVDTDAYYMPYLVVGIFSFLCFYINYKDGNDIEYDIKKYAIKIGSGMFSLIVLLSNYSLWLQFTECWGSKLLLILVLSAGGYFTAKNILVLCASKVKNISMEDGKRKNIPSIVVFWMSFTAISFTNIFILFACKYPGVLSPDSMWQIDQIMNGSYSNHHPFYHTITIKVFISAGLKIFGNINAAVAMYHVFQILFMAMCFSMVSFTLYEMEVKWEVVITVAIAYVLMPYHIMYSFTMWKDVTFGGFVTLFLVFIYRILRKIGKIRFTSYLMLLISGIGVCLFRSNGFFAFLLVFIVFVLFFWKDERKICYLLFGVLCIGFLMKHSVLHILEVSQPDIIEALSVPLQQIARVEVEQHDFSEQQRELIEQIINMEEISDTYTAWLSDPMKELVRKKGNQQYITSHKVAYIKLYFETGIKHPWTYIKAWVDQTKGFWNAGYDYWRWKDGVIDNSYGIVSVVNSEFINRCLNKYLWTFSNNRFLQIFLCIGFHVWVELLLCFVNFMKENKVGLFLLIPNIALIISILITTPVYAEFRYSYFVFCNLPFLIATTFISERNKKLSDFCTENGDD